MNAAVPCVISAYQHNLVSDLVTANVRDLFIQIHWGSWGKSPCSTGPYLPPPPPTPLSLRPCLVSCMLTIRERRDWWSCSWCLWQLLVTLHKSGHPCHMSTSLGTFGHLLLVWNTGPSLCFRLAANGQMVHCEFMYAQRVFLKLGIVQSFMRFM